jgi:hypothetical protein
MDNVIINIDETVQAVTVSVAEQVSNITVEITDVVQLSSTQNLVQKSAAYTILTTNFYIEATANSFILTLPTAVGFSGKSFVIKNSGTGVITVDANGSQTIDGSLTAILSTQYESVTVVSNGSNWIII